MESISFKYHHLVQIYNKGKLTAEQVQDYIHAFAFDISKNNKNFRTGPLNVFMGIVNIKGEPYLAPLNYESPRSIKLGIYNEKKRREKESQDEMEKENKELDFQVWLNGLDEKQRWEITHMREPKTISGRKVIIDLLRAHHSDYIWPLRQKENL